MRQGGGGGLLTVDHRGRSVNAKPNQLGGGEGR
jgi:hypothetical protein